ncbi:MAG: VOC family protein [Sphaerochaetaceae bacterium]
MEKIKQVLPFLQQGVDQIGYVVKSVEETAKQYYQLFGIGDWHFYTYGKPLLSVMKRYGEPTEYKMYIALSYFGSMRIELIEHLEGDTVYLDFIKKHGYGVQHLGFLVDDMASSLDLVRQANISITMEGGGHGPDNDGYFAYLDTEDLVGTTIELIERPQRRHPPQKVYP